MKKIFIILILFLFCKKIYSQQNETQSEEFNRLINYIPSTLKNEKYVSDLEKKYRIKLNNLNTLFNLAQSKEKLKFTKKDISIFEKQIKDLAIAFNKDEKLFILKGYMSHGCNPISSDNINGKQIKTIVWCYGSIVENDKPILNFFRIFNNQVKQLI